MKVLTVIAISVAAIALACNGDGGDSPSLDEYFRELDELQDAGAERVAEIEFPQLDESAPLEDSRDAYTTYFDDVVEASSDITDDMAALEPPDEAREAHDEYVEALRGIDEFADGYKDRIAEAESSTELAQVLLGDNEGDAVTARIDAACGALQQIATDNSIDIDLECEQ